MTVEFKSNQHPGNLVSGVLGLCGEHDRSWPHVDEKITPLVQKISTTSSSASSNSSSSGAFNTRRHHNQVFLRAFARHFGQCTARARGRFWHAVTSSFIPAETAGKSNPEQCADGAGESCKAGQEWDVYLQTMGAEEMATCLFDASYEVSRAEGIMPGRNRKR